ncbi:hypothetical protein DPMN_167106 [Dreissena polymorpha]|uniref:Sodium/solute symporter n=1 Tax=Dreissena polymorpha TaxID=45954 RepID=A0A9D4F3U2_DREPO|nr:hypothetical protein DPMN_167106 [Dreissena polymorpha]
MTGMIFAILIYGCIRVGGVSTVIEINRPTGRLQILDFDPNPYKRHTFWTLAIGNGWMCAGIFFSPPLVQHLNSVRSIGDAKKEAAMSIPAFVILQILIMCEGLVAYAYFSQKGCDPVASKQISNPNQIMPYLVRDLFASVPGITGLFLSALCSASLSTISSLLSSISAVTSEDIIRPRLKEASEKKLTQLSKLIVVMAGVVCIGIAILISQVKGPMVKIARSNLGAVNAPMFVVFFLSIFVTTGAPLGGVSTAASYSKRVLSCGYLWGATSHPVACNLQYYRWVLLTSVSPITKRRLQVPTSRQRRLFPYVWETVHLITICFMTT